MIILKILGILVVIGLVILGFKKNEESLPVVPSKPTPTPTPTAPTKKVVVTKVKKVVAKKRSSKKTK